MYSLQIKYNQWLHQQLYQPMKNIGFKLNDIYKKFVFSRWTTALTKFYLIN
jgi:hypothetical protein